jgi:peptide/nickel transport system permease protein
MKKFENLNANGEWTAARDVPRFIALRRNKALKAGLSLVSAFYLIALCADFLVPYDYRAQSRREPLAPPAALHFCGLRPCFYAQQLVDPLDRRYAINTRQSYPIAFFIRGYTYRLGGIISTNIHLFGVADQNANTPQIHLLGTDQLGRSWRDS